jgi:hypothetical protein
MISTRWFLGLLFACFLAEGQAQSLLSGQVRDDSTGQPLAYVRLSLRQAQRGTLTNEDGRFRLSLPADRSDTLEVFVLGYEPQRFPLAALTSNQLDLRLQPRPLSLAAVTILSVTAEGLLRRAVELVPDNYPNEDWLWEGFYREVEDWWFLRFENGKDSIGPQKAITVGEALVEVVMPTYDRGRNPEVRLLKGRLIQPEDLLTDSIDESILALASGYEEEGGPPSQAAFDLARHPKEFSFLKNRADKWYEYELKGVLPYQGRPAYRIDFAQRPEEDNSNSLLDGTVYLDTASLAFVSIRYYLSESARLFTPEFSKAGIRVKVTDIRGRQEFRLREGRWTLAYNDYETEIYLGVPDGFLFKKDFKLEAYLRIRRELLLSDLRNTRAISIPREEQFLSRDALSKEIGTYDPAFWDGQAILPLDQRLLEK